MRHVMMVLAGLMLPLAAQAQAQAQQAPAQLAPAKQAQAQQPQQNPSFNLVNKSTKPVKELYVTPAGDANWGQNRLTSGPIAPGGSFAVRRHIDGNCIFDIRAVYADATKEEKRAINTCNTADVAVGGGSKAADDPTFRLTNHLKQPITELEASPVGQPRAANALSAGALAPEASFVVHPEKGKGCRFELRVVLEDHSAKTRTLDLCAVSELSIP